MIAFLIETLVDTALLSKMESTTGLNLSTTWPILVSIHHLKAGQRVVKFARTLHCPPLLIHFPLPPFPLLFLLVHALSKASGIP